MIAAAAANSTLPTADPAPAPRTLPLTECAIDFGINLGQQLYHCQKLYFLVTIPIYLCLILVVIPLLFFGSDAKSHPICFSNPGVYRLRTTRLNYQ